MDEVGKRTEAIDFQAVDDDAATDEDHGSRTERAEKGSPPSRCKRPPMRLRYRGRRHVRGRCGGTGWQSDWLGWRELPRAERQRIWDKVLACPGVRNVHDLRTR